MNDFREGTYTPQGGAEKSTRQVSDRLRGGTEKSPARFPFTGDRLY